MSYRDSQSFVMADIPGIIEGASEGKGLGLRFLRHIERNAVLLFMIPADTNDIRADYEVLCRELEKFNPDLVDKPRVLAITKCDMLDDELMAEMRGEVPEGIDTVFISSVAGMGLVELKDLLWRTINDERNRIPEALTHRDLDRSHRVQEEDDFVIETEDIDDDYNEGVMLDEDEEWDDEYWPDKHNNDDEEDF